MGFEKTVTITITLDGDQWCALVGEDLQNGVGGFGNTPKDAVEDLLENFGDDLEILV